jgi:Protein of unknown function (DUF4019)
MMRRMIVARAVVVLALALLATVSAVAGAQDTPEQAAQQALESWLPLWDAGQCAESYTRLAEQIRKDISQTRWCEYWSAVRKPLGALKTRRLREARYLPALKDVPDRDGAMLQYDSTFENRAAAVETIGMVHERDGSWRVANYLVQ